VRRGERASVRTAGAVEQENSIADRQAKADVHSQYLRKGRRLSLPPLLGPRVRGVMLPFCGVVPSGARTRVTRSLPAVWAGVDPPLSGPRRQPGQARG
jgi:hypothetical protein